MISISKEHRDWLREQVGRYLICVDLTTNNFASKGISVKEREVVEWSAAVIDLSLSGRMIDEYSSFVRPILRQELSAAFCSKTGIRQEIVDKAPTFKEVNDEFGVLFSIYGEDCAWCSWGSEDRRQIEADSARHGVTPALRPDRHIDLKSWYLRAFNSVDAQRLDEVIRICGLEWRGAECRSISEVRNMALIIPHALGIKHKQPVLYV